MTTDTTAQADALREIERVRCETRAGVLMRDCGLDAETQRDVIEAVMAALASSPAPLGEAVHLGIRFGHGAVGVSTGAYDGDAAVFLREAVVPGTVGAAFSDDEREAMPLRAVLLFPTAAQAKAVADALVTPTPQERQEAQGADHG